MEKIVPTFIEFLSEKQEQQSQSQSQMEKDKEINGHKSWQEPGEYYKAAAGILPICIATGRVLLFLRTPKDGDEDSNKWALAGGMMKDEELKGNPKIGSRDAALREFKEETGMTTEGKNSVFTDLIASYVYSSPNGSFNYYNFIGVTPEEFEPTLNKEHTDYKWFTLTDLKAIPRDRFHFGIKLLFANDENTIQEYAK